MTVTMRRARADDAAEIERLYRQLVTNPFLRVNPERLQRLASDAANHVLVGEMNGRLVCTALFTLCADIMFDEQPYAVLENVVVDEALRGQGVGRALMAHVDALALQERCSKIMLLSSRARIDAHVFFGRCGYDAQAKQGFVRYRSAIKETP